MVGVDISDRSIKVAELTDHELPRLRTVCWSPVAANVIYHGIVQDVAVAAATLRAALTSCSPVPVVGRKVVVSIPETQSFVRVVTVPMMLDTELEEAVRWAVREHIPFDLDRVYLDWEPLPAIAGGAERHVLVGAARRDVVDPLLAVIDELDLQVVALELEAQAIARCLLPREAAGSGGVLLVDLGATTTNIIFFDEGSMHFTAGVVRGGDDLTQRLAQQLHLQPSLAAEKKALVGVTTQGPEVEVATALREITRELIDQVKKVVQQMTVQEISAHAVQSILLSGGSANLPGIVELFQEAFGGIPVQLGNPWVNLTVDERTSALLSPADAAHFTTAFGLALRRADDELGGRP